MDMTTNTELSSQASSKKHYTQSKAHSPQSDPSQPSHPTKTTASPPEPFSAARVLGLTRCGLREDLL